MAVAVKPDHVAKRFGALKVLKGINFEIAPTKSWS